MFYLCIGNLRKRRRQYPNPDKVLSAQALGNGLQAVTTRPTPSNAGTAQAAKVATP